MCVFFSFFVLFSYSSLYFVSVFLFAVYYSHSFLFRDIQPYRFILCHFCLVLYNSLSFASSYIVRFFYFHFLNLSPFLYFRHFSPSHITLNLIKFSPHKSITHDPKCQQSVLFYPNLHQFIKQSRTPSRLSPSCSSTFLLHSTLLRQRLSPLSPSYLSPLLGSILSSPSLFPSVFSSLFPSFLPVVPLLLVQLPVRHFRAD